MHHKIALLMCQTLFALCYIRKAAATLLSKAGAESGMCPRWRAW